MNSSKPPSLSDTSGATEIRQGKLTANLIHFCSFLRTLGIAISTRQINELTNGLVSIDLASKDDFFITTRAFLVHKPEQFELFERAFRLFWEGKLEWLLEFTEQLETSSTVIPDEGVEDEDPEVEIHAIATYEDTQNDQGAPPSHTSASASYSSIETLRRKDFIRYSDEELELAKQYMRTLIWRLGTRRTRRRIKAVKRGGYLDIQRAIRGNIKHDFEILNLAWQRRQYKPRPIVVLCDISGSMEAYSRIFLNFMYSLVQEGQRVETFAFGTRLTRITQSLKAKDVEVALAQASGKVLDWSGGTRIGASLLEFNLRWSRRVLGRGAMALIISDGWDRGELALLEQEISRLKRSVSRLFWLNPLMGAPEFEPLVGGIRTVAPYVDHFLPIHNLQSLETLALQLGKLEVNPRLSQQKFEIGAA